MTSGGDKVVGGGRIAGVAACLLVGTLALFVIVIGRVAQLQIAPGERLAEHMSDHEIVREEWAPRGDLLDRRGRLLAGTRVGRRVFVDPVVFPSPGEAEIRLLAAAMELDISEVGERIVTRQARNERRQRERLPLIRYVSIGDPLPEGLAAAVKGLRIAGVHLEKRSVRESTAASARALVGKVGVDHDGLLGAEFTLDERLAPESGRLSYVHDARGAGLWIEAGSRVQARAGTDVRLSVDLAIQEIVEEELERGIEALDAQGMRSVVVDPVTGEVLAMADLVREPEDAVEFSRERWQEALRERKRVRFRFVEDDPRRSTHPALARNRCVEDVYEPGSTFKPFMWASVTERGLAAPEEMFDTEGGSWRTDYGRLVEDVVEKDEQTWREVLVNSSNIGMAKALERMTARQTRDSILRFGFGRKTGVGLPGEAAGLITSPTAWSKYTQTSVAFGYEVAVTPVQMARAFCAFARSGRDAGTLPPIRLTAMEEAPAGVVHRVLPDWVAATARMAMQRVAEVMDERTLRAGVLETASSYTMFGKSGTAQAVRPDRRGYLHRQYVSSFVAGAPTSDARLVVLVVVDDPGPGWVRSNRYYGSWTAGPVARRIVERSLLYLGVAPDIEPDAMAQAE